MKTKMGTFAPFGAKITEGGVQYTFVANTTDDVYIAFYRESTCVEKLLIPKEYRIGNVYSVEVLSKRVQTLGYRYLYGKEDQIDPYATAIVGRDRFKDKLREKKDFFVAAYPADLKALPFSMDRVSIAPNESVIYKMHMRGFTMRHGLSAKSRGNYLGVIERLPYLKELGITSIELQPIYEFEEFGLKKMQQIDAKGHVSFVTKNVGALNYWGYGAASYFAPKASYFGGAKDAAKNCATFVDEIHKNGMEVILEMSFEKEYAQDYILDVLHFWVRTYHIDGLHLLGSAVPIARIVTDPWLSDTKIFYDYIPMDLVQKQDDPKHMFVYEDGFMFVCRQLQNHLGGSMVQFTNFFRRQNKEYGFVNYLANTTGFTMFDSYCYGEKHNLDNGEQNRDGSNFNESFNYGVEGPSRQKSILFARRRAQRNGLSMAILAQATPLLLSGDEIYHTAKGNNNPYCQDNPIGWVDFAMTKEKEKLYDFTKRLIAFRKAHTTLSKDTPMLFSDYAHIGVPDVSYHEKEPWIMQIGNEMKAIGILYAGDYADPAEESVLLLFNFHYDTIPMALPQITGKKKWALVMNTSDETTHSFEKKPLAEQKKFDVPADSICILTL